MGHPPRIPVWLRWEQNVIYFVTICVANRKPVLANDTAFSAFNTAVAKLQQWTVLAAILMPDHLHAIVSPKDREIKIGNFSGALKRWIRQELGASWNGNQALSIVFCGRANPCTRNGFTFKKTRSVPVS